MTMTNKRGGGGHVFDRMGEQHTVLRGSDTTLHIIIRQLKKIT